MDLKGKPVAFCIMARFELFEYRQSPDDVLVSVPSHANCRRKMHSKAIANSSVSLRKHSRCYPMQKPVKIGGVHDLASGTQISGLTNLECTVNNWDPCGASSENLGKECIAG